MPNHLVPLYCGKQYWNFYEWRDGLNGRGRWETAVYESPLNAFISDAFRCFARICELLADHSGQNDLKTLAAQYQTHHRQLNQAIHAHFFDAQSSAYLTRLGDAVPRHVLTQGLMLYVDAVPREYADTVTAGILSGSLTTNPSSPEFASVSAKPAAAGTVPASGSLCHGWSAVPVYLFGKYFTPEK